MALYETVNPELGSFFAVMYLFLDDSNNLVFEPSQKEAEDEFGEEYKDIYWGASQASKIFVSQVAPGSTYDNNANEGSIAIDLQHSSMSNTDQVAFRLASLIVAESFTIQYMIDDDGSMAQYITPTQIDKIMQNCDILCRWLGKNKKYLEFLPRFRELYIGLGYARNQTSLLYWDATGAMLE